MFENKNHFCDLHSLLCDIFYLNSVLVA
ncbi:DUF6783 domain-containing protein [Blautia sp. HCP3S3_H10_1]